MSGETIHPITIEKEIWLTGQTALKLLAEHGSLEASYHPAFDMLMIENVDVEPDFRRDGIAKALLKAARDTARELAAKEIIAVMVSRESIDAFTSVFGQSAVNVMSMGTYATADNPGHQDALAALVYRFADA